MVLVKKLINTYNESEEYKILTTKIWNENEDENEKLNDYSKWLW